MTSCCCCVCACVLQEAIQRALEEDPELAAQLDPDYLNKVGLDAGVQTLDAKTAQQTCRNQRAYTGKMDGMQDDMGGLVCIWPAGAEGQIALRLVKELAAAGEKVVAGMCLESTPGPSNWMLTKGCCRKITPFWEASSPLGEATKVLVGTD